MIGGQPFKRRHHLPVKQGEAPKPTLAVWEITLACDHRCLHCGPRAGIGRDDELDTEECLSVVAELAELGVGEVVLIGGEAYLRSDFLDVIAACREKGMAVTMTTGGFGLHAQRCIDARAAGLTGISVSIDGMEETHDLVRNKRGSWKRAFEALANARDAGIRIAANTQINGRSIHELDALFEKLAEAGVWAWQVQITMAHGNAADNPELMVQPHTLPEMFEGLRRIVVRSRELGIQIWPANNIGYFGPYEQELRFHQRAGSHFKGCKAGQTTIGIESNGQIKSCPSLGGPTNLGGSWREHGLRALWERSPEIAYTRHRTVDDLWGYCRDCYYADVCRAGCTATSEPLLGRPGNNPYCIHRALDLRDKGLRERVEHVRDAPDIPFGTGLFRIVREPIDESIRAKTGPVAIEGPRSSRLDAMYGPGEAID